MGQCAGVVVRGSSTGARDCPPAAATLRPVASAGSGGPTVEEREGSTNRRQDWRNTLFNVTAAMLAALFTVGAGVAGVAVAGFAVNRDDARSDREFLQAQRTQLYGRVLDPGR